MALLARTRTSCCEPQLAISRITRLTPQQLPHQLLRVSKRKTPASAKKPLRESFSGSTCICDAGSVGSKMIENACTAVTKDNLCRRRKKWMATVVYSINCGGPPISAWCQQVQINYHSQERANTNYSPVLSSVPPEIISNLRNVADIFNSCASVGIKLLRAVTIVHIFFTIPELSRCDSQPS